MALHMMNRSGSGATPPRIYSWPGRLEPEAGEEEQQKPSGPSAGRIALFLFVWLMVGFSTGTSTLMGPVRWTTALFRRSGWGPSAEAWAVRAVILLFVLGSAAMALWLTRVTLSTAQRHLRFGVPALAFLAAAAAFWLWSSLGMLDTASLVRMTAGQRFTFGPYPSEETLQKLKAEGYTAVISLLHPTVPFEPKLLSDERAAAAKVGIELIHLPLLPWVSRNMESLDELRQIVKRRSGRFYVHCYLGMDRILLVKNVVEQAEPSAGTQVVKTARSIKNMKSFERGDIYELEDGVYLTPYPTDSEYVNYIILGGGVKQVVSLLDPANAEDLRRIEKERALLSQHNVRFDVMTLAAEPYDPYRVLQVARAVRGLPRPLVVHGFHSPSTGRESRAEAFLQAYRSNLPPLPPSQYKRTKEITVIAPHIAVGPSPEGADSFVFHHSRGVREFVFLGDPQSTQASRNRAWAEQARASGQLSFNWQALPSLDSGLLDKLASGGPWYLYGPALPALHEEVARRFGPAVPDRMTWTPPAVAAQVPAPQQHFLGRFFERALPKPRTIILLGPILLFFAALAGTIVGWLRLNKQVPTPHTRKIFHFTIFTLAGVLQLLGGLPAVVLFGSLVSLVVFYAIFRGEGFPLYEAMARPTDRPHRTLFIIIPWLTTTMGGLTTNILFARWAYVGYLVGGWGDAVGEPVGTAWGKHRYTVLSLAGVPATRSLEGSSAVLVVGVVAAFAGLWAGGVAPWTALKVGALCGVVGAAVEAISNHGLDNFTIQVVAAGMAYWFLA